VLASVEFDDRLSFEANEIENEVGVWMLAAKLAGLDLAPTQALPKPMLGIGWRVAQSTL